MSFSSGEQFKLRPSAREAQRRRLVRRFGVTVLAAALLVTLAFAAGLRGGGPGGWGTLVLGLGLLLLLATWSYRRRAATFQARWGSFTVVLEAEAVARSVAGHPVVRIARADVASVGEAPAGLVVRSRGGTALVLPRELEGYERLRSALAAWGPPPAAEPPPAA